jgi:hypothetical protein
MGRSLFVSLLLDIPPVPCRDNGNGSCISPKSVMRKTLADHRVSVSSVPTCQELL